MNILVTGGASGLGEAITRRLAAVEGFKIYFTYCHSKENALILEKQCGNTRAAYCDFTKESTIQDLVEKFDEWNLDILVNNALVGMSQNYFHKIDTQLFKKSFEENVLPVVKITQKAIEVFRKKKSGKIITILSAAITQPPIGMSEYCANKAYLASLSLSWARENEKFNITSDCVSPTLMKTGLTKNWDTRLFEKEKLLTVGEAADKIFCLLL